MRIYHWILTVFVGIVVSRCGTKSATPSEEQQVRVESAVQAPSSAARWVRLEPGTNIGLEFPARVLPLSSQIAEVTVPLAGRIAEVLVTQGDRVEVGGPIAVVILPELVRALSTIRSVDNQLGLLENRRSQLQTLRNEGLARASDLLAVEVDIARLRGEKASAQALFASAGVTVSQVDASGRITLHSPISGVVSEIQSAIGRYLQPEDGFVAKITGLRAGRVEALLPTIPPQHVSYRLLIPRQSPRELRFVSSAPVIQDSRSAASLGVRLWFELQEPEAFLMSQSLRVQMVLPEQSGVMAVPQESLLVQNGQSFVWLRNRSGGTSRVVVSVEFAVGNTAIVRGDFSNQRDVAVNPTVLEPRP